MADYQRRKYQQLDLEFNTEMDILRKIAKKYAILKEWYISTIDTYDGLLTKEDLDQELEKELMEAMKCKK